MAHQPHLIPWELLTSNFKWSPESREEPKIPDRQISDFRPQWKPNQGKDLTRFTEAIAKAIEEQAKSERKKYQDTYTPPNLDEDIVGDDITAKILPIIQKWRKEIAADAWSGINLDCSKGFANCESKGDPPCCPILPLHERKMSAFCRQFDWSDCYQFFNEQTDGYFNMEVVKTLVLYGDMEPLLRASAHANVGIDSWQNAGQCSCMGSTLGWSYLRSNALMAYIGFNMIYFFSETWDANSGSSPTQDYRTSRFYQNLVHTITESSAESPVTGYPHYHILGIEDLRARDRPPEWDLLFGNGVLKYGILEHEQFYGRISNDHFLMLEDFKREDPPYPYDPNSQDVLEVQDVLYSKGLPTELTLEVLEFADYSPKGRVPVPHDPLHPNNKAALAKYLDDCWQVLIRYAMLANELKIDIDWTETVHYCISRDLWLREGDSPNNLAESSYDRNTGQYSRTFK